MPRVERHVLAKLAVDKAMTMHVGAGEDGSVLLVFDQVMARAANIVGRPNVIAELWRMLLDGRCLFYTIPSLRD